MQVWMWITGTVLCAVERLSGSWMTKGHHSTRSTDAAARRVAARPAVARPTVARRRLALWSVGTPPPVGKPRIGPSQQIPAQVRAATLNGFCALYIVIFHRPATSLSVCEMEGG